MAKVSSRVEAFKRYGAKLKNPMWAVSSEIPGAVVMSLWKHRFQTGMVYVDRVDRWGGAGNKLFREHLSKAWDLKLPVHLVIAETDNPDGVDRGEDATNFKNTFFVRPELIGEVETFAGEDFTIRFRKI